MKFPFVIGVLFFFQRAQSQELSFVEVLRRSQEDSLTLKEAKTRREQSTLSYEVARSKFLPELSLQSQANWSSPKLLGQGSSSMAGLFITQNLFKNGHDWNTFEQARLKKKASEWNETWMRESAAFDLFQVYLDYSYAQRRMEMGQRRVQVLEKQFDLVRRQFRQGLKTQRDYQIFEAELERSRLLLEEFQWNRQKQLFLIQKLSGFLDPGVLDLQKLGVLNASAYLKKQEFTKLNLEAPKEFIEVLLQDVEVEVKRLAWESQKRTRWPELNAQAGVGYVSRNWGNPGVESTLGLSLNWTLWDWGAKSAQVEGTMLDWQLLNQKKQSLEKELKNEFFTLVQEFEKQKKALQVQEKIAKLERTSFVDIEREYQEGRLSYLNLLNALDRDLQAEIAFETEAFAFLKTTAKIKKQKGELYESLLSF